MGKRKNSPIKVTFWGVRGSIPAPGPETMKYGGNTPCVTIETPDNYIILDAGSGIRRLAKALNQPQRLEGQTLNLFITHTHWDHIQGLPFFATAFVKGNTIRVFGPKLFHLTLEKVISTQMEHSYFPIRLQAVEADTHFIELDVGRYNNLLPGVTVETCVTNHPVINMAYKFTIGDKKIAYVTDNELYNNIFFNHVKEGNNPNLLKIGKKVFAELLKELQTYITGVDLLIIDAFFTRDQYQQMVGWGHSTFSDVYELAGTAGVKQLCFFHHDPNRNDNDLAKIEHRFQQRNRREHRVKKVFAAREGTTIKL